MLVIPELGSFEWPSDDIHGKANLENRWVDAKKPLEFVSGRQVCVQAGGNCGVWPRFLSREFQTVYTFEPDPRNFLYLCRNVPELNVVKFNAALGYGRRCVRMELPAHESNNVGALQCGDDGNIPTLRIDDLGLPACDLIQLDIEGMEILALMGAVETIKKYSPVIMIEDKGLSEKYGYKCGEAVSWLANFGYEPVKSVKKDIILCKKELSA